MNSSFRHDLERTLAYYELFNHPLTGEELYTLFPSNSMTTSEFRDRLAAMVESGAVTFRNGYYFRSSEPADTDAGRTARSLIARGRLKRARVMAGIMRLFPFVRGVFVSGDLSKGVATSGSDIDYMIITSPGRLWICRTLLILFKKIFLLNSKKYFCVNYFVSEDHLVLNVRNYYTATEIAHLKPLVNMPLFLRYMNANAWIKEYFPNFTTFGLEPWDSRPPSRFSSLTGAMVPAAIADSFDTWLMNRMKGVWRRRYPEFDEQELSTAFTCTKSESRAFGGNYSGVILSAYSEKLREITPAGPDST